MQAHPFQTICLELRISLSGSPSSKKQPDGLSASARNSRILENTKPLPVNPAARSWAKDSNEQRDVGRDDRTPGRSKRGTTSACATAIRKSGVQFRLASIRWIVLRSTRPSSPAPPALTHAACAASANCPAVRPGPPWPLCSSYTSWGYLQESSWRAGITDAWAYTQDIGRNDRPDSTVRVEVSVVVATVKRQERTAAMKNRLATEGGGVAGGRVGQIGAGGMG